MGRRNIEKEDVATSKKTEKKAGGKLTKTGGSDKNYAKTKSRAGIARRLTTGGMLKHGFPAPLVLNH